MKKERECERKTEKVKAERSVKGRGGGGGGVRGETHDKMAKKRRGKY